MVDKTIELDLPYDMSIIFFRSDHKYIIETSTTDDMSLSCFKFKNILWHIQISTTTFNYVNVRSKHCTILFFRSQILSLSFVKIMSQIQSLSFCGTFSVKWATILSWSRSDHSQSFQKVRFTTKIFILRQYFGVLFFKNILYQNKD